MIRIGFYGTPDDAAMWRERLVRHLTKFELTDLMSDTGRDADVA